MKGIYVAIGALIGLVCIHGFGGTESQYPIRWTGLMNLHADIDAPPEKTLGDIRGELSKPWYGPTTLYGAGEKPVGVAANCLDFFKAQKAKWQPGPQIERNEYSLFGADCIAAKLLLESRPATLSYLEVFKVDKNIASALPPEIGFLVENQDQAVMAKCHSLTEIDKIRKVKVHPDGEVELFGIDSQQFVDELARADFNGDGIQDVILEVTQMPWPQGSLRTDMVLIFTRLKAGGPLTMIGRYGVY